jgi:hypothetical protein
MCLLNKIELNKIRICREVYIDEKLRYSAPSIKTGMPLLLVLVRNDVFVESFMMRMFEYRERFEARGYSLVDHLAITNQLHLWLAGQSLEVGM